MVKMIITDLDDTFLRGDKIISDYTVYIHSKSVRRRGLKLYLPLQDQQKCLRNLSNGLCLMFLLDMAGH